MNEEEKFDELLSSKLSERDFPFDELNWDEAERLINQQERRERITRFTIIFSGGLAAGVLIMLPFILNTHSALPNTLLTKSIAKENIVVQSIISPNANQSTINTNNTIINKEGKAPLPVQSAFVKKDTRTGIRGSFNTSSAKIHKEHPSLSVADIKKPRHSHNIPAKSNLTASAETSEYVKTESRGKSNSNENEANASSPLPITNSIVENVKPTNSATTDNNTSSINTQPVIGGNPMKNLIVNNDAPKNKKDTLHTNSPPPILPPLNPDNPASSGPPSTNILSVYAGGNYSFGWNNNGDKEGNRLTPWAGFDFTHYFAGDFSASLGIGYSELTNLNKTYTSSVIQYDFGVNSSATTVTPQTVYYLAFPFKLQWNLDTKNMFGLGINYLLMLTTSSTLTTYTQSYNIENNSVIFVGTPGNSVKQNGYTQGFSNSDIQLAISYTRMFSRLGISPEVYRDFDNVENNSVSGLNQNTKNMGFRLVLSYQLMK